MGFFSSLFNFFGSLFSGLSPESKQKQDIKKSDLSKEEKDSQIKDLSNELDKKLRQYDYL